MMQIKPKISNFATLVVGVTFCYLFFVIWTAKERFPDIDVDLRDLLGYAILALELGGQAVMDVGYGGALSVSFKGKTEQGRDELLTKADLLSNKVMLAILQRFPGINIISEEKSETLSLSEIEKYLVQQSDIYAKILPLINSFPSKKYNLSGLTLWIDPLDATQEFSEGLVTYVSVMVCITFNGEPIFGGIYRPFNEERVYGMKSFGILNRKMERWHHTILQNTTKTILISRSHSGSVKEMLSGIDHQYSIESAGGSGYKCLRLLNGTAGLYIHKTEIKMWDTCAGDALLRSIGGCMLDFDGSPLNYIANDDYKFRNGLLAAAQYPFTHFQHFRKNLIHR